MGLQMEPAGGGAATAIWPGPLGWGSWSVSQTCSSAGLVLASRCSLIVVIAAAARGDDDGTASMPSHDAPPVVAAAPAAASAAAPAAVAPAAAPAVAPPAADGAGCGRRSQALLSPKSLRSSTARPKAESTRKPPACTSRCAAHRRC